MAITQGMAVAGLILNILILPGLGSLIVGKTTFGILQLGLFMLGAFLTLTIIGAILGIPLMFAMWVWAIVTSVEVLKKVQ